MNLHLIRPERKMTEVEMTEVEIPLREVDNFGTRGIQGLRGVRLIARWNNQVWELRQEKNPIVTKILKQAKQILGIPYKQSDTDRWFSVEELSYFLRALKMHQISKSRSKMDRFFVAGCLN